MMQSKKIHYIHNALINPVHKVTVSLIGAGGTGSRMLNALINLNQTLKALEHPGIHVRVFDPDIVTSANIGRQLFFPEDEGKFKVDALVTKINRIFGWDWYGIPEKANENAYHSNIAITCTDNISSRIEATKWIESNSRYRDVTQRHFYWMDIGNSINHGQVVLGSNFIDQPESKHQIVGKLKNVAELYPELLAQEESNEPSCSLAQAVYHQDLYINYAMAIYGANLLWKMFKDKFIDKQGYFINLSTGITKPIML